VPVGEGDWYAQRNRPQLYAVVFAFIWIACASADFAPEIFGSLLGHHNIRVWGLSDRNRKSWEDVADGFLTLVVLGSIA
jgi:hypothetical protein